MRLLSEVFSVQLEVSSKKHSENLTRCHCPRAKACRKCWLLHTALTSSSNTSVCPGSKERVNW